MLPGWCGRRQMAAAERDVAYRLDRRWLLVPAVVPAVVPGRPRL